MTEPAARLPGTVIQTSFAGKEIFFFLVNPRDVIQSWHYRGEFYETEELSLMSRYMSSSTRYLDVGTNIGNHVLYLRKCVGIGQISCIEPSPLAALILQTNLRLNNVLDTVDLSMLGVALSDAPGRMRLAVHNDNLGGARCITDPDGKLRVSTGDKLLADQEFDFVKIDVETMEMKCLKGMEGFINRCRPTMFIEVDNANVDRFKQWCDRHRYEQREQVRRYQENVNFLVVPVS